jgi:hypothetical protein
VAVHFDRPDLRLRQPGEARRGGEREVDRGADRFGADRLGGIAMPLSSAGVRLTTFASAGGEISKVEAGTASKLTPVASSSSTGEELSLE